MIWRLRNNGTIIRCPRCGGFMEYMIEKESSNNGVRIVRYVVRCWYCGFRDVMEEVKIRITPQGGLTIVKVK